MKGVGVDFYNNWSRGKLKYLDSCPVCKVKINYNPLYKRGDDFKIISDTWIIFKCIYCKSNFINPRPSDDSFGALYQDYLTHKIPEKEKLYTSNKIIWALIRGYIKKRFGIKFDCKSIGIGYYIFNLILPIKYKLDRYGRNLVKLKSQEKKKLLDVGCGAGDFLEVAKEMLYEVYGCDFDPEVINLCKKRLLNVRCGDIDVFSGEKFDVITLNQVLEHISDQKELINKIFSYLKSDGVIWLALPNPNSLGQKVFGKSWAGLHPPYHLSLPSQEILKQWLEDAGFVDVKIIKRGPHAKANWKFSKYLSESHSIRLPNNFIINLMLLLADFLNLFTSRWSEETVIMAKKK